MSALSTGLRRFVLIVGFVPFTLAYVIPIHFLTTAGLEASVLAAMIGTGTLVLCRGALRIEIQFVPFLMYLAYSLVAQPIDGWFGWPVALVGVCVYLLLMIKAWGGQKKSA